MCFRMTGAHGVLIFNLLSGKHKYANGYRIIVNFRNLAILVRYSLSVEILNHPEHIQEKVSTKASRLRLCYHQFKGNLTYSRSEGHDPS